MGSVVYALMDTLTYRYTLTYTPILCYYYWSTGGIGGWREHFTVAMSDEFDEVEC